MIFFTPYGTDPEKDEIIDKYRNYQASYYYVERLIVDERYGLDEYITIDHANMKILMKAINGQIIEFLNQIEEKPEEYKDIEEFIPAFIEHDMFIDHYFPKFTKDKQINKCIKERAKTLKLSLDDYIEMYADDNSYRMIMAIKVYKAFNKKYPTRLKIIDISDNNIVDSRTGIVVLATVEDAYTVNIDEKVEEVKESIDNEMPLLFKYYAVNMTEQDWYDYIKAIYEDKWKYAGEDITWLYSNRALSNDLAFVKAKRQYLAEALHIPPEHVKEASYANQIHFGPGVTSYGIHYFAGGRGGSYGNSYSYHYDKISSFTRMYRTITGRDDNIRIYSHYVEISEYYLTTLEQLGEDLWDIATPEQQKKYFKRPRVLFMYLSI